MTVMTLRAAALLICLGVPLVAAAQAKPDALTPDGGRYFGPLVNGQLHGKGRLEWSNGTTYEGDFKDGLMSGKGRLQQSDGRTYDGEFRNGEFTGKGTLARKDGARYEGGFRKWVYHGPGRYADGQGGTWEGSFENGQLKGRGTHASGGFSYEGEFQNWLYHGRGVLKLPNGDVYEGGFANGVYEGEGTLTFAKPRPDGRTQDKGKWRYGYLPNEKDQARTRANVETALYAQKPLLDKAVGALKPRQPGRINLYLLGVAGDGSQEVFRREVEYVGGEFAKRFGTAGRTVLLVNSRNTPASAPMATLTSIRESLKAIAARMDREQDILFLFLTSHGSKEHELTLNMNGMSLQGLRAARLGELLKASGIRWKVVVVSACYSGGFLDALRDEHTLVMTAARHDRRSFGCADENDFTYFGRAFFKEALPGAKSFQDAFRKAEGLVAEWEDKDASAAASGDKGAKVPKPGENRSFPQIAVAPAIEAQLRRWWAQGPATPR